MAVNKAETLAALAELNDHRAAVDLRIAAEARAARAAGATWNEIGRILGITRQAAQQRFGAVARQEDDLRGEAEPTDSHDRQEPEL
jgi:predicted transcriptional regulator